TGEAGARRRDNRHGNLGIAGLRLSRCEGYLQLAGCFIADGIGAARIDVDRDGRSDCSTTIIEQLYGRPSYGTDHLERFSVRARSGTCNLTQVNGHTVDGDCRVSREVAGEVSCSNELTSVV